MDPNEKNLPLMEDFYTIQGEGFNTGEAAYFIRLAGCDVGCIWCDVKESWDEQKHPVVSATEIVNCALKFAGRTAVITGGEPLMYNLETLCETLKKTGFKTWLETSGAYPLTGTWDWICISPKKFKAPLEDVLAIADELKIVVYNKTDLDWAEKQSQLVGPYCKLYLQPEYSVFQKVTPMIIDYIKLHPQWKISIQVHKVIDVP